MQSRRPSKKQISSKLAIAVIALVTVCILAVGVLYLRDGSFGGRKSLSNLLMEQAQDQDYETPNEMFEDRFKNGNKR